MNKKADEKLVMNKLIVIILCILVLLALLMFIFKVDILEWIRNLPDYTYQEDKELPAPEPGKEVGGRECPIVIGKILNGKNIKFCGDEKCTEEKLIDTKLLWKGTEREARIEVNQIINNQIGDVREGKIEIYTDVLRGIGNLYYKVKKDLPSRDDLLKLNGAEYFSGNYLCRKEKFVPGKTIPYSDEMSVYFKSKSSKVFTLRRDIDDLVIIRWNFKKQKPEIIIRPDEEKILVNDQEVWLDDKEKIESFLEENKMLEVIDEDYLKIWIKGLLSPDTPSKLAGKIRLMLSSEGIYTIKYGTGEKEEVLSLEEINKRLYRGNPDELFKDTE